MSKSLESQVWKSNLKAELKPLAAVMADMGNDDGVGIYPSVAYLAWLLGRSQRAVQVLLKELSELGIATRTRNAKGGRGLTPQYHLDAGSLPFRPPWAETRKGADSSPFVKGADSSVKGAVCDIKGADSAPDPLVRSVNKIRETRARPRKPGSLDDGPKFGIEMIRELPDEWMVEQRAALKRKYPDLNFDYYHDKWCLSRFSNGGIGRGRRHTVTLNQFAADLELYFANCEENRIDRAGRGGNGSSNQKPVWMAPDR